MCVTVGPEFFWFAPERIGTKRCLSPEFQDIGKTLKEIGTK